MLSISSNRCDSMDLNSYVHVPNRQSDCANLSPDNYLDSTLNIDLLRRLNVSRSVTNVSSNLLCNSTSEKRAISSLPPVTCCEPKWQNHEAAETFSSPNKHDNLKSIISLAWAACTADSPAESPELTCSQQANRQNHSLDQAPMLQAFVKPSQAKTSVSRNGTENPIMLNNDVRERNRWRHASREQESAKLAAGSDFTIDFWTGPQTNEPITSLEKKRRQRSASNGSEQTSLSSVDSGAICCGRSSCGSSGSSPGKQSTAQKSDHVNENQRIVYQNQQYTLGHSTLKADDGQGIIIDEEALLRTPRPMLDNAVQRPPPVSSQDLNAPRIIKPILAFEVSGTCASKFTNTATNYRDDLCHFPLEPIRTSHLLNDYDLAELNSRRPMQVHLRQPIPRQQDAIYNARYKTKPCLHFQRHKRCPLGANCHFAHGPVELQQAMQHPKFRTRPCRNLELTGKCPYGDSCFFLHDNDLDTTAPVGFPEAAWIDKHQLPHELARSSLFRPRALKESAIW